MAFTGIPLFTGEFRHALDDKNRLTVPAPWRSPETLQVQFLATPHPDGYIAVLPPLEAEKLQKRFEAIAYSNGRGQNMLSMFYKRTQAFTHDKQGRFMINDGLLAHSGIDRDTVLIGAGTKFNIFAPAKWDHTEEELGADFGNVLRELGI